MQALDCPARLDRSSKINDDQLTDFNEQPGKAIAGRGTAIPLGVKLTITHK